MHRFYLPPDQCKTVTLTLTGREAHHAAQVLRIQNGDQITVLDGEGSVLLCSVTRVDRKLVQLSVVERKSNPPLPARITLLQALPKGKLMDSIVQKATELGVSRIVPLITEHVVSQLDEESAPHKVEKWRQAGIEAIKQCGSPWLPAIESPVTPSQFIGRKESFDLLLVGALQNERRHLREVLREYQTAHSRLPQNVAVWIGPEGDFTPEELSNICDAGAKPITLGQNVLRVETAAVYCLSVLNHELSS
jgi:16S rRNA (uracil1498-N3)-methyltransferase